MNLNIPLDAQRHLRALRLIRRALAFPRLRHRDFAEV